MTNNYTIKIICFKRMSDLLLNVNKLIKFFYWFRIKWSFKLFFLILRMLFRHDQLYQNLFIVFCHISINLNNHHKYVHFDVYQINHYWKFIILYTRATDLQ